MGTQNSVESSGLVPTGRETVQEILNQLKDKKSFLGKRIAVLILPPTVIFVVMAAIGMYVLSSANQTGSGDVLSAGSLRLLWTSLALLALAILYYVVVSSLFFLEKLVWVDSRYDKKILDEKTSWRIAKKLFWPSQAIRVQLFFRYYVPGAIVAALLVYMCIRFSSVVLSRGAGGEFLGIANIVIAALLVLYFYALKIKFKFLWFIFLDLYGQSGYSFSALTNEMKLLNTIDKEKIRSRAIVLELLNDAFGATGGRGIGVTAGRVIANEPLRQAGIFAKTVAYYALYRHARTLAHNNPQYVNETLYQL